VICAAAHQSRKWPRVKGLCRAAALAGLLLAAGLAAAADPADRTPGPRCEIAVVNPVSNYAECVKPRGAHVDPPPKRAIPTEEECHRHPDLDVEQCRQSARPSAENPQS
jgi:hypothetical protein